MHVGSCQKCDGDDDDDEEDDAEAEAEELSGCAHAADPQVPKPGCWFKCGRFGLRDAARP